MLQKGLVCTQLESMAVDSAITIVMLLQASGQTHYGRVGLAEQDKKIRYPAAWGFLYFY